jgi:hypothetical protein
MKRYGRTLLSVGWSLLLVILLQFADYHGWFSPWNARVFNWILRFHGTHPDTQLAQNIFIVEIDDAAYQACFRSQSPMDPARIVNLVSQIATGAEPRTIGVDVRTEGPAYADSIASVTALKPSLVWVSAFEVLKSRGPSFPAWLWGASDELVLKPQPVLGIAPGLLEKSAQTRWGVPVYPKESDGAVRQFPRTVDLETSRGEQSTQTWATKVANAYCGGHCGAESAQEVYLSYAGVMPRSFKMLDLFTCPGDHDVQPGAHSWEVFRFLARDHLVLVGGTFQKPLDFYETPVGEIPGVMINAYAVKAELTGNGYEEIEQPLGWLLDWGMGLLLLVLNRQMPKGRPMQELAVGTIVVAAVCLGSLFVAHGRYLIGFGGEGIGVLLDQAQKAWDLSKRPGEA